MCTFMTNSSKIMDDIAEVLQNIPEQDRCKNSEVLEVTSKFRFSLTVFDAIFSMARLPSGFVNDADIRQLQDFVAEGMRLWRALKLSMEAPKPHAVEDHLCDQIIRLKGIGDLGEDWVEQSHQDGIRDNRRSSSQKDQAVVARLHCRWEQKRKLPAVQMIMEDVKRQSIRLKLTSTVEGDAQLVAVSRKEEKNKVASETKKNNRMAAFQMTSASDGPYLMTGRQRNEEEMKQQITKRAAQTIIGKTRVSLAKQLRNRVQKAIKKINQQTRVLLAKLLLNKKKNPLHVQA